MLTGATGEQFGVVMILMSIGMLSGFFILLPLGKKLSMIGGMISSVFWCKLFYKLSFITVILLWLFMLHAS